MTNSRLLPIGIQSFEKIRQGGYLYVDKTEYVYRLVHAGAPCFLSRPRRFGKSLLLSTMRAYWEGRKELFTGLKIAELEQDDPEAFQPHPVFYFDFNRKNYKRETALEELLTDHMKEWERIYGDDYSDSPLEERFQHLLVKAVEQSAETSADHKKRKAVVLIDEYDKSLLETMSDPKLEEHNKAVFKGFFSTLKSFDEYLQFVFITGVTKFSKVSIFSDLNQLNDISMDEKYACICGITDAEMRETFFPEIDLMAENQGITREQCLDRLKSQYDGYHFAAESDGVYNPFSLISALSKQKFGSYWFETGTPTFLIQKLQESRMDLKKLTDGSLYAEAPVLSDYRDDNPDPVPLFYQTGYLTIKGYDEEYESYELGYPNDEVKYGFLKRLAPSVLHNEESPDPLDIRSFGKDIDSGRLDSLRDRFTALFARLPYPQDERILEQNFQNVIYIVFMLLGKHVHTELHSSKGRADCIVETKYYIYIFEFKRDKSAEEALSQIEDQGYALPYAADPRKLFKIGVNFDSKNSELNDWKVRE